MNKAQQSGHTPRQLKNLDGMEGETSPAFAASQKRIQDHIADIDRLKAELADATQPLKEGS